MMGGKKLVREARFCIASFSCKTAVSFMEMWAVNSHIFQRNHVFLKSVSCILVQLSLKDIIIWGLGRRHTDAVR